MFKKLTFFYKLFDKEHACKTNKIKGGFKLNANSSKHITEKKTKRI